MTLDLIALQLSFNALMARAESDEAEALVRPLVASGRASIPVWQMLAQAIRRQGRITETRAIQEMLVATLPGDLPRRFDLSETLLLLGEFERGWREYRFRYDLPHTTMIARNVQRPSWEGKTIPGRLMLVNDEC